MKHEPSKCLALFDFDGTLTTSDSFLSFLIYAVGWPVFIVKAVILIPVVFCYKLKIIPNDKAKEIVTSSFFKAWPIEKFKKLGEDFSGIKIKEILNKNVYEKLIWHKNQGHTVAIVTASFDAYLKEWCVKQGVELVATELEIKDGRLTGNFLTKNCYGVEKRRRIEEKYDLKRFDCVYAYGDSCGDKEMLSLADKRYYKNKEPIE